MRRLAGGLVFSGTLLLMALMAPATTLAAPGDYGAVTGIVYDQDTQQPVPYVTVQAPGTGRSTLANADGRYRLVLPKGTHELKLSHIGYYSVTETLDITDSEQTRDFYLHSSLIEIKGMKVFTEAYDPAQQIIMEAIRRKKDILSKLHDYSYDAYTKFVVWDDTKPDSSEIFMLAESQTTAFWEQPDQYKEIITARKASSNIDPENVIVSVGEILNFNKNRIDIGKYSIVTPTAKDALDHYNYYLMDTVFIDSLQVFVLEIEPKSSTDPLFLGTIHIADSTYDVVRVDVSFNEAVRIPMFTGMTYAQRFALLAGEYWMPIDIGFSAQVEFGVPFPGIPSKLSFDYVASLYSFSFEEGHPEGTFDEYELVVDEKADDIDTVAWNTRQAIPLTMEELRGYERLDSISNAPKPVGKKIATGLAAALLFMTLGDESFFHYNRVEGAYLGVGHGFDKLVWDTDIWAHIGYGFESKDWSYRLGARREVWSERKLWLSGRIWDDVVKRPTVYGGRTSTFGALYFGWDASDYYREKGFSLGTGFKLVDHVRLRASYHDAKQTSLGLNTNYSFFGDDNVRSNPAIVDGQLRSVWAGLTYDSRPLILDKGEEFPIITTQFTRFIAGVGYASPDFIDNDFHFKRYYARLFRRQRTLGLGLTSLSLYWGDADGSLPPQQLFTIADDGDPAVFFRNTYFRTLSENNYSGDEMFAAYARHDFGTRLTKGSGLPLLRNIPFEIGVHGGIFWLDFDGNYTYPENRAFRTADKPYSEAGFSLSNLTPFLTPFNLAMSFTWRLSGHDTEKFHWMLGFDL